MRPFPIMLALALNLYSIGASATDVDFEVGSEPFEEPMDAAENFAIPTYDHPLYVGLWPTTLAAFRDSDPFTFNIPFAR